jgi:siroheme decarboxylase
MTARALDPTDRAIVVATQAGLPLTPQPYQAIAEQVGVPAAEILERLRRMLADGMIRRIGIVPNHYALGLTRNAMTVWDVADDQTSRLGAEVGTLPFVTHCYRRPRRPPAWPYNLFAMVHGTSDQEITEKTAAIATLLGDACRGRDVLVSTRILKKSGLRIAA